MSSYLLLFLLSIVLQTIYVGAGVRDIIGTSAIQYQSLNQVFPRGSSLAQGFVRFNNGFTIARDASAQLDTFITVSGGIDIRSTGTLDLLSDLSLASHFTFSSSDFTCGYINGRGNAIIFDGDTRLQRGKTLKIISNTIIDGGGHSFIFEPFAQMMIDRSVTLTLRNMTFLHTRNSSGRPSIGLAAPTSKLALQDVKMALSDDFFFNEGSLFIHGDVVVTGSKTFAYRSAQSSFIDSHAVWLFDTGSTYFHDPKATVNNQMFMCDRTSTFGLNNATLLTTQTGMRLSRGLLTLDNAVTFSSTANTRFIDISLLGSSVTDIDFTDIKAAAWSYDNQYAAMTGIDALSQARLEVYTLNGVDLTNEVTDVDNTFSIPFALAWSHDNRFIVVAGENALSEGKLQMYKFEPNSLVKIGLSITDTNFAHIYSVAWSNDDKYVIVVGEDTSLFGCRYSIYSFNGTDLTLVNTASDVDFDVMLAVDWSTNNNRIVIGGFGGGPGMLKVYSFNGTSLTTIGGSFPAIDFVAVRSVKWSPDGQYVLAGGQDISIFAFGQTEAFYFDGSMLNSTGAAFNDINFTNINGVAWSPDGRRIIVGGMGLIFGLLQTYVFDGSSVTPVGSLINETTFFTINAVSWVCDDRYILVGGQSPSSEGQRAIYGASFGYDPSPQCFKNGIVFGDASRGPGYDLDVEVFGGARVVIDGKLLYDNVV